MIDFAEQSAGIFLLPNLDSYVFLTQTTRRIWHDGLQAMSSIQTRGNSHRKAKLRVISAWRSFGLILHLREGVDVMTLISPSTPSDEDRYWKIDKRCYYSPCLCSHIATGTPRDPQHAFRVCRGCYRVLYFNERCQAL